MFTKILIISFIFFTFISSSKNEVTNNKINSNSFEVISGDFGVEVFIDGKKKEGFQHWDLHCNNFQKTNTCTLNIINFINICELGFYTLDSSHYRSEKITILSIDYKNLYVKFEFIRDSIEKLICEFNGVDSSNIMVDRLNLHCISPREKTKVEFKIFEDSRRISFKNCPIKFTGRTPYFPTLGSAIRKILNFFN